MGPLPSEFMVMSTPPGSHAHYTGQAIVDSAPEVFQALERCAAAAQSVSEGAPRGILRVAALTQRHIQND
jgi:hypothetical protein